MGKHVSRFYVTINNNTHVRKSEKKRRQKTKYALKIRICLSISNGASIYIFPHFFSSLYAYLYFIFCCCCFIFRIVFFFVVFVLFPFISEFFCAPFLFLSKRLILSAMHWCVVDSILTAYKMSVRGYYYYYYFLKKMKNLFWLRKFCGLANTHCCIFRFFFSTENMFPYIKCQLILLKKRVDVTNFITLFSWQASFIFILCVDGELKEKWW